MRIIALAAILGYEKARFALRLAVALRSLGYRAGIIDSSDHAPLPQDGDLIIRLTEYSAKRLYNEIENMAREIVVQKL